MAQITLNSTGVASSGSLVLQSNGTTAAVTINTSQIIGVGITPSAWGTGFQSVIETKNVGALSAAGPYMSILANAYYNSSNQYIYTTSNPATHYAQVVGQHQWFNAASGTAGNAITFTQAMTLDANGNLGIGTSSPTRKLEVIGNEIRFSNSGNAAYYGYITHDAASTGANLYNVATASGGGHQFQRGGTTQMTLDASGNLLVKKTSFGGTATGGEIGENGVINSYSPDTTNSSSTFAAYSNGASAYRFYVGWGGTIFATSITITAISDQRLKENVRDIDTGLSSIMALKPRRFDWKEGKGQDKKNVAGFIAQEFEDVFPECVGTSKAGGDGIEYKNINHETLIPTLVKAIQEQQTLITTLTARITALESA